MAGKKEELLRDFDSPWKQVCDNFFPEMLEMVLHEAYEEIDWDHPFRLLDKELPKVDLSHLTGLRVADKLIEVRLKDGEREIVFIHVEFQNQVEPKLSRRMYKFNHRISDKFDKPVVSLAVLGDASPNWRPKPYRYKKWRFDLSMSYPIIKLLDYRDRVDELKASSNPFAHIILAFLAGLDTRTDPQRRLSAKIGLIRRLYRKKFSRTTIVNLFQFIDWTLELPATLAQQFRTDLEIIEGETNMPYITSIERMAREEGKAEGIEEGRQSSIRTLAMILTHRFGSVAGNYYAQMEHADVATLELWIQRALTVEELHDLFDPK